MKTDFDILDKCSICQRTQADDDRQEASLVVSDFGSGRQKSKTVDGFLLTDAEFYNETIHPLLVSFRSDFQHLLSFELLHFALTRLEWSGRTDQSFALFCTLCSVAVDPASASSLYLDSCLVPQCRLFWREVLLGQALHSFIYRRRSLQPRWHFGHGLLNFAGGKSFPLNIGESYAYPLPVVGNPCYLAPL